MTPTVDVRNLVYRVQGKIRILDDITVSAAGGTLLAILGENGAGKTTLLDTVMGFRKPFSGTVRIDGMNPVDDNWRQRKRIAYLSEKVDLPGDWSVRTFLDFNSFFYDDYSIDLEHSLCKEFGVDEKARIGNLSAGEVRRVQVVGALSYNPSLIVVDEITAVLDIVARRKFIRLLSRMVKENSCTALFATNILEDVDVFTTHILLLSHGKILFSGETSAFLDAAGGRSFAEVVAGRIVKG